MLNDIRRVGKEYQIFIRDKKSAVITDPWLSSGGQITIGDKIYSIIDQSKSFLRDKFILESKGVPHARIESQNVQNSKFNLILPDDTEYKFIVGWGAKKPFEVYTGSGYFSRTKVGGIYSTLGVFQKKPEGEIDKQFVVIDLPSTIPLPSQLFAYWFVLKFWLDPSES
jgi:hypothetical protein